MELKNAYDLENMTDAGKNMILSLVVFGRS
jgi:hypothetical protein